MNPPHPVLRLAAPTLLTSCAALGGVLAAAEPTQVLLPEVYVSALAVREDASNVASPYSLLEATEMFRDGATTLGDALSRVPGVHSDTFGGGASRPVIRGQAPPRVAVLSDGGTLFDASSISPDHAVTAEPLLSRRIEVLRGPATLLYGSGAIGGVVNVLDHRIPEHVPEAPFSGSVAARGNTANQERSAALELDGRLSDSLTLHFEAFGRDTADYRVPGPDSRVAGTFADAKGTALGLSKSGDWGYFGLAYSWREEDYGLPGHEHAYENCEAIGSLLDCGEPVEEEEGVEEEPPYVELESRRLDVRGAFNSPLPGIARLRLRASHTDYQHQELEEGVAATTFTNKGQEVRLEAEHVPWGRWVGVLGVQHSDVDTGAVGEEAFVPVARQRSTGLFLIEHFELSDRSHLELGVRQDWQSIRPIESTDNRPDFSDTALSFSAAAVWELPQDYRFSMSIARSERLPFAQELYARGIHLATNTWECGLLDDAFTCGGPANNAPIGKEVSRNIEVLLRRAVGDVTFSASAFHNDVQGYIHARTLDRFDGFRLIKYTARDARFTGFEAEVDWQITDRVSLDVFGDVVRARFTEGGGDLPRIPPLRIGARLGLATGAIDTELEWIHVTRQSRIADFETATPGHNLVNAGVSWQPASDDRLSVFLRGSNLLDETVRNHTSFLADRVPQPGRSLGAGVRWRF